MKRTRRIDLSKMRKAAQPGNLAKVSIVLGGSYMLTGCDSTEAYIYRSVSECALDNPLQPTECEFAYRNALADWQRTAPRYRSMSDCEYDFGYGDCRDHSNRYIPRMAGFMLSENQQGDDDFDLDFKRSKALGRSRTPSAYNKWVGADGTLFGEYGRRKMKVSGDSFTRLKGSARTIGRGGFGKTISSRSSRGS